MGPTSADLKQGKQKKLQGREYSAFLKQTGVSSPLKAVRNLLNKAEQFSWFKEAV